MNNDIAGPTRPTDPTRPGADGSAPNPATPPPLPGHLMPTGQTFSNGAEENTVLPVGVPAQAELVPATLVVDDGESVVTRGARRWFPKVAVGLLGLLLMAMSIAALSFRSSSQEQTARALAAETSLAATEADLASVSAELTETTSDLTAQTGRADDLDQRVSELTNEKAQVQDERNSAEEQSRLGATAAAQMLECRDMLLDAMTTMLSGSSLYPNYSGMNARLDVALPVCQAANSSVDAFIVATQ